MSTYLNSFEEEKIRHPFYQLMELKDADLTNKLNSWSRLDLIEWLCWNDRNGVYRDKDSLREFGNILCKNEAIDIITTQIMQD